MSDDASILPATFDEFWESAMRDSPLFSRDPLLRELAETAWYCGFSNGMTVTAENRGRFIDELERVRNQRGTS